MARKIKLSIIIVNYNTLEYTKQCIASIVADESNKDYEIIIVDNASKGREVKELEKSYHGKEAVSIIENQTNVGFAKANNQAIKKAQGDYILLLNPDTLVEKETLGTMVRFMETNADVGVATCQVVLPTGELDDACHRGFPTPWNAFCQFTYVTQLLPNSTFFNGYHLGYKNLDKIHEIDSCAGAFMLIRRNAGGTAGWLDEDYFWYGEDIDLCYRVKEAGWKIMFVPGVKVIHYKGVASGIKKHSQHLSSADLATQLQASKARFEVMRIFYRKHYVKKYPAWMTRVVLFGITLKERLGLLTLNRF